MNTTKEISSSSTSVIISQSDDEDDLNLKLQEYTNSNNGRKRRKKNSFYLGFDRGIDSDFDEFESQSTSAIAALKAIHGSSWPKIPPQIPNENGEKRDISIKMLHGHSGDPLILPSPMISPSTALLVPPEQHPEIVGQSRPSSPTKSTSQRIRITSSPSTTPNIKISNHHQQGLMALAPYGFQQLPHTRRLSRAEKQSEWRQMGADALTTTLSALYGKLLVVMGTAFPMAEVISTYIPPSFYEAYYLYLYIGSMFFLLYMYTVLLRDSRIQRQKLKEDIKSGSFSSESDQLSAVSSSNSSPATSATTSSAFVRSKKTLLLLSAATKHNHYGSFYLRMGAVAFGIGSMIYSGLEFGQYFELERNTKCHNVLLALTPATRMAFIFIQMYFIFLNNEQMSVYKHKVAARFGLMHMIGTNLSVWLNVLVQETKHEILTFYNPENNSLRISHRIPYKGNLLLGLPTVVRDHPSEAHSYHTGHHRHDHHGHHQQSEMANQHQIDKRGLKGPHQLYECRRTNIMGSLVQDASPFLFPCTIEYSLICAAILYVMWRSVSKLPPHLKNNAPLTTASSSKVEVRRSPHHYSVDCARAHKGLFVGILLLVLTIISLIVFFVLISKPEFAGLAVIEVNICELTLYGLTTLASVCGMWQVHPLKYDGSKNLQLDSILLVGAQTGMFIYSTFTIIGGQFTIQRNTVLVLVTALTSLLQTTCQTIFILDASRRSCVTADQMRRKPGRQIVTFLLVTNLAMWAINTLEKSRAESHPIQLHFYGLWAWTIITHVSMPLAIFYRFHSTVCLCEIWKRTYKIKPTYI